MVRDVNFKHLCMNRVDHIKHPWKFKRSLKLIALGPDKQHFIFFILLNGQNTLECYITLIWKGLQGTKHSSLLGPFISYKEDEYRPRGLQIPIEWNPNRVGSRLTYIRK